MSDFHGFTRRRHRPTAIGRSRGGRQIEGVPMLQACGSTKSFESCWNLTEDAVGKLTRREGYLLAFKRVRGRAADGDDELPPQLRTISEELGGGKS